MIPDRLTMELDITEADARFVAKEAVEIAKRLAPRLSGRSSQNLRPIWGTGYIGVYWPDEYVWFQEVGIRPFTMTHLAGKTIPMWVNDPTGELANKNPKAERRTTADGRQQVLIFRKAAPVGSRKTVERDGKMVDVPRSYPGAPGRIGTREYAKPWTTPGKVGGRIARTNVGVRWRHPGLQRKGFIRQGLVHAAEYYGFEPGPVRDNYGRFR